MAAGPGTIVVDGVRYTVHFQGFDAPLAVRTASGLATELLPWRFHDYLSALRHCLLPVAGGLRLDGERLAGEMLLFSGIPRLRHEELMPLALWWAVGGEQIENDTSGDEIMLGAYQFRLHRWTAKERMDALAQCLMDDNDTDLAFDFMRYVELMIRTSVIQITPAVEIETLNAALTSSLINAVTSLNVADSLQQEIARWASIPGLQNMLQSTLQLCKVLGWGPSQVWALSAADLDRLLAMTKLQQPAQAGPVLHSPRITSDPNAVVIHIEGDA